jgi:serine/threonine-protein kinase
VQDGKAGVVSVPSSRELQRLVEACRACPHGEIAGFLDGIGAVDPALRRAVEIELAKLSAGPQLEATLGETPPSQRATESDPRPAAASVPEPAGAAASEVGGGGPRAGPYELLHQISAGGMGTVWVAVRRSEDFKKRVAIKLLRRDMNSADLVRRFRVERQILAAIDHPNIAKLFDGGTTEDGLPFFAMEFIEGQRIDEYCDSHRLSLRERLVLFQKVCAAVHFAHQNLVVHRDLKPGNILVTADGIPKLLDFGIAKLLSPLAALSEADPTRTELRIMTPEYASPEQILGEPVTTASDIYSLGVLLYELLTGHRPYRITRGHPHEISRAVCEEEPIRPSLAVTLAAEVTTTGKVGTKVNPETIGRARSSSVDKLRRELAGDLDTIVLTALRKEPQRRYASAEQLAEDIWRYLEGLPVKARRGSRLYRAGKFVRRHTIGVAATTAAFLALLVFGLSMAAQRARIEAERDRAEAALRREAAVSAFLEGALGSANPYEGSARDITVVALLDRAVRDLDWAFADMPETRAALQATVGTSYMRLGRFDDAEVLLRAALAVRRELHVGGDDPDVATSMNDLANLLRRRAAYAEAEGMYREALAMRQRLYGAEHPEVAAILHNLGAVRDRQSDYNQAETYYRQALTMRRKTLGSRDADVAESENALSNVLRRMGRYQEAERLCLNALALRREIFGGAHPLVAESLNDLAFLYYTTGDLDRAEPLYVKALALRREALGDLHPETAQSMTNLGRLLRKTGRLDEAEALYREALAARREVLGEMHPEVATNLNDLATLHSSRGDFEEAERLYRQSLAMRRELLGNEHWYVAMSLNNLAVLLNQTGRPAEAEPLYRESLRLMRLLRGDRHPDVAVAVSNLADVLIALGRHDEAEALLVEALEIRRAVFGDHHVETARSSRELADLYERMGRMELADRYRKDAEGGPEPAAD